jgi:hypothetical protein
LKHSLPAVPLQRAAGFLIYAIMITNLLATVSICLVTNQIDKFPQHQVQDPSPRSPSGAIYAVYICHMENDENPTNKEVVTEIKSVQTIKFNFNGEHFESKSEKLISSSSEKFILNKNWEKIP